jgi:hypothetical protein
MASGHYSRSDFKEQQAVEFEAHQFKVLEHMARDAWYAASTNVKNAKSTFSYMSSTFDDISRKVSTDNIESLEKKAYETLWEYYEKREQ